MSSVPQLSVQRRLLLVLGLNDFIRGRVFVRRWCDNDRRALAVLSWVSDFWVIRHGKFPSRKRERKPVRSSDRKRRSSWGGDGGSAAMAWRR